MNDLLVKYARVLLNNCLKVYEGQPLLIRATSDISDFVRIVAVEAYKMGVKDIYFDITNPYLQHDALKYLEVEDLKQMPFWNKKEWNEYAKKDAAFLMLVSEYPTLMSDIDPKKMNELSLYSLEVRKEFDQLRDQSKLSWCIAAVPVMEWAREVFSESETPMEDLWNAIFDVCHIKDENPEVYWQKHIEDLAQISKKLNEYKFKTLKYSNSMGTDFSVDLPKGHIWCSGAEELQDGRKVLVNFPTEEVFTSPDKNTANGTLFSSKPLLYNNKKIDGFSVSFKDGKVVDFDAKEGKDTLSEMINSCEGMSYLGEVALVESSSAISKTNILFYETLFDENAACHVALGASFPTCIENGPTMSPEELDKKGLNDCVNHVDFMIGTDDLQISGITEDGTSVPIFEDGNFTLQFKR